MVVELRPYFSKAFLDREICDFGWVVVVVYEVFFVTSRGSDVGCEYHVVEFDSAGSVKGVV